MNDDCLLCMISRSSCPWLTPYPLREYSEITHQVEPSPLTGILHESRGLRPCSLAQHSPPNEQRLFRSKGYWITTCPQIQGSLEGHMLWPESIKCHYLSKSQVWTVLSHTEIHSQGFSGNLYWQRHQSPLGQPQTGANSDQLLCFCRSSISRLNWLQSTNFLTTSVTVILLFRDEIGDM